MRRALGDHTHWEILCSGVQNGAHASNLGRSAQVLQNAKWQFLNVCLVHLPADDILPILCHGLVLLLTFSLSEVSILRETEHPKSQLSDTDRRAPQVTRLRALY